MARLLVGVCERSGRSIRRRWSCAKLIQLVSNNPRLSLSVTDWLAGQWPRDVGGVVALAAAVSVCLRRRRHAPASVVPLLKFYLSVSQCC